MTTLPVRAPNPVLPGAAPGTPATAPTGAGHAQTSRLSYILLTAGLVVMLGPFLWMFLGSLKPAADFLRNPPTFMPSAILPPWSRVSAILFMT